MKNNSQKGIGTPLIIAFIAVALVIIGAAFYAIQSRKAVQLTDKAHIEREAIKIEKKEEGAIKKKEGGTTVKYTGNILAGVSSLLIDFNKADYDTAIKTDKLIVLYFYANWCPICKFELPKLYAAFNELTTDKVIGFRVNYNDSDTDDDERGLASQFGVAYQHTKVFVKNGQRILKAPDSWDKDRYLSEINKALTQ